MLGLTDGLYKKFTDIIQEKIGVKYGVEQKNTLNNRLMPLLIANHLEDFNELYSRLSSVGNDNLLQDFIGKVTTNHTYFYRENSHFEILTEKIFSETEGALKNSAITELKYWVAASSTGEEPYTIAMLLHNHFVARGFKNKISILATDISRNAINIASAGVYKTSEFKRLPQHLQDKYVRKIDDHTSEIVPEIKNMVLFRVLNLIREEFPFSGKFDIIFLRNVMIYFDEETKTKLIGQLISYLNDDGYLFIGQTEALQNKFQYLKSVYPSIYKKNESYV